MKDDEESTMLLMVAMLMADGDHHDADGDHLCEVQVDAQHLGQPNDLAAVQQPALVVVDFVKHLAGLLLQGLGRACPQRYCWHSWKNATQMPMMRADHCWHSVEECNPEARLLLALLEECNPDSQQ